MGAPKSAIMPSPVNLSTKPSNRSTPSDRMRKKRCMMALHASGSICSASSIEPFTSAKSTVTCLRSPSRVDFDCRILSARCLGVSPGGTRVEPAGARAGTGSTGRAHCGQNRAPAGSSVRHPAQPTARGVAQCMQKRAPGGESRWQSGQLIEIAGFYRGRRRTGNRLARLHV
jgi:hypothetical protein